VHAGHTRPALSRSVELLLDPASGLPSDNVSAAGERSRYTSPTNVGAYLWSTLAARDTGVISPAGARRRNAATLAGVARLERHGPSGMSTTGTTRPPGPRSPPGRWTAAASTRSCPRSTTAGWPRPADGRQRRPPSCATRPATCWPRWTSAGTTTRPPGCCGTGSGSTRRAAPASRPATTATPAAPRCSTPATTTVPQHRAAHRQLPRHRLRAGPRYREYGVDAIGLNADGYASNNDNTLVDPRLRRLQRYFTKGAVERAVRPLLAMEEFTAGGCVRARTRRAGTGSRAPRCGRWPPARPSRR
jgi:hypothetical protein